MAPKSWVNEDQSRQLSRISRESHGFWQFLKAHGRETQSSRIFVNLTECCDRGIQFFFQIHLFFTNDLYGHFNIARVQFDEFSLSKASDDLPGHVCLHRRPVPFNTFVKPFSDSLIRVIVSMFAVSVTGFQMTIVCFTSVFTRSGIDFHRQLAFVQ